MISLYEAWEMIHELARARLGARPLTMELTHQCYRGALESLRGTIPGRHFMRLQDEIDGRPREDRSRPAPKHCSACGDRLDPTWRGLVYRPAVTGAPWDRTRPRDSGMDLLCWRCTLWAIEFEVYDPQHDIALADVYRRQEAAGCGMAAHPCMPAVGPEVVEYTIGARRIG